MARVEYYINRRKNGHCIDIPSSLSDFLRSDNYLSEYYTDEDKKQVRDNLGITDLIEELRSIINTGRISEGDVGWDTVPTEEHTNHVLSSDSLYKILQDYAKKDDVNNLNTTFREYITNILQNYFTKEETRLDIIEKLNNFYESTVALYDEQMFEMLNKIAELEDKLKDFENLDIKQSFGDGRNTTISQKFLTDSYKFLFDLINEISPRERVNISISPTSFAVGETANVNIIVNGNGLNLETIKVYLNGREYVSVEEENYYELTIPIETNSTIRVEASLLGFTYEKELQIIESNAFYIGGGQNWNSVKIYDNAKQINGNAINGSYDITLQDNDHIFIIVPKNVTFNRADMSGVEISTILNSTDDYNIYISVNTFNEGTYNIDIT